MIRRLLPALVLCLLYSTPAWATRERLFGWCQQGGVATVIPGTAGSGTQRFQQTFRGCTVTIYLNGTSTAATLFSSDAGAAQANPFIASSTTGFWSAYVDGGRYDIRYSEGGIAVPFTISDYRVPNDVFDVTDFGAKCDGTTNDYTAVNNARIAATGQTNGGTVLIPSNVTGSCIINTSITFDADVTLAFEGGGRVSMASATTATINGSVAAPPTHIFTGSGNVRFGANAPVLFVYPQWWGALCNDSANDTVAIQAAVDAFTRIQFTRGTCRIQGEITITMDNTEISGAGMGLTTIVQHGSASTSSGILYFNGGGINTQVDNVRVGDLTLSGRVSTLGFSEFQHLMTFSGVRDALVQRVKFLGFQGDGLALLGTTAGSTLTERHNYNVSVKDCVFDGVNRDNRNGVSIIDCDQCRIEQNYFTRTTRSTMPGAIDIEPDANAYHVVRSIHIVDNDFVDISGAQGIVAIVLSATAFTTTPTDFVIDRNSIVQPVYQFTGIYVTSTTPTETTLGNNIRITNNFISGTLIGMEIVQGKDIYIAGNTVQTERNGSSFGSGLLLDTMLFRNTYRNCGLVGGSALNVYNVTRFVVLRNIFSDCGAAGGGVINFQVTSTSNTVKIIDNFFNAPSSGVTVALAVQGTHTLTGTTNQLQGNDFSGLTSSAFTATATYAITNAFSVGSTSALSGFVGIGSTASSSKTGFVAGIMLDVDHASAKAAADAERQVVFAGSSDAANPLGLSIGFRSNPTAGSRYVSLDASEVGSVARPLYLQSISNGPVSVASGTIPAGYAFYVNAGTSGLNGRVYAANLTTSAAAQTNYVCSTAAGEFIAVAVAANCATSSRRFKFDIAPYRGTALSLIAKMKPVTFRYNTGDFKPALQDSSVHFGFIAEDVAQLDTRLVTFDETGQARGFQYEMFTAVLAKAVQELKAEIDRLKRRVDLQQK